MRSRGQPSGPDGPQLLDVAAPVRVESSIEPPPNRGWWVGIGGLALVLIVGWSVLSSGGGDEQADPSTTTAPSTTERPTTTTRPRTTLERSTTTTSPDGGRPVGEGPLLGEEVGFWLAGVDGSLELIDLDRALLFDPGISMDQLFAIDDGVAFGFGADGTVSADLVTGELVRLAPQYEFNYVTDDPAPEGQRWLLAEGDQAVLRRVDIRTGETFATLELPRRWNHTVWWTGLATISTPSSGGIYRLEPGGPRQVSEGGLVGLVGDDLLVERCDEFLRCERTWIGLDGSPVDAGDRFAPEGDYEQITVLSGSTWLFCASYALEYEALLFDTATGTEIELPRRDFYPDGMDISPDGRWLAMANGSSARVLDLTTGEEHSLPRTVAYSLAWIDQATAERIAGAGGDAGS